MRSQRTARSDEKNKKSANRWHGSPQSAHVNVVMSLWDVEEETEDGESAKELCNKMLARTDLLRTLEHCAQVYQRQQGLICLIHTHTLPFILLWLCLVSYSHIFLPISAPDCGSLLSDQASDPLTEIYWSRVHLTKRADLLHHLLWQLAVCYMHLFLVAPALGGTFCGCYLGAKSRAQVLAGRGENIQQVVCSLQGQPSHLRISVLEKVTQFWWAKKSTQAGRQSEAERVTQIKSLKQEQEMDGRHETGSRRRDRGARTQRCTKWGRKGWQVDPQPAMTCIWNIDYSCSINWGLHLCYCARRVLTAANNCVSLSP